MTAIRGQAHKGTKAVHWTVWFTDSNGQQEVRAQGLDADPEVAERQMFEAVAALASSMAKPSTATVEDEKATVVSFGAC